MQSLSVYICIPALCQIFLRNTAESEPSECLIAPISKAAGPARFLQLCQPRVGLLDRLSASRPCRASRWTCSLAGLVEEKSRSSILLARGLHRSKTSLRFGPTRSRALSRRGLRRSMGSRTILSCIKSVPHEQGSLSLCISRLTGHPPRRSPSLVRMRIRRSTPMATRLTRSART